MFEEELDGIGQSVKPMCRRTHARVEAAHIAVTTGGSDCQTITLGLLCTYGRLPVKFVKVRSLNDRVVVGLTNLHK
jgi:hypothetical protein